MRVVHVSDCYGPRVGGIEVQVAGLARAQAQAGHDVSVITLTPGAPSPLDGRVEVRRLLGAADLWTVARSLSAVAASGSSRTDVLHVHASLVSPLAAAAAWAGARLGVATVVTVHSVWGRWARALYGSADPWTRWSRWPVVWTTVSEASAAAMRPLLPVGPRVVPNAVDLSFWQPRPRTARLGAGLHVVAVGRLVPRKRPMDVVAVLHAARQQLPPEVPLRATLVGDGPERGRVAHFLARHDMAGWVRLAGNLPPSGIRDVLADADVFLAPATLESFGIAALEARTAGLPVLARTGTGVADFVRHGRDGLLATDRQGLAAALVRLHDDPALLAAITAHNRAHLPERFGWSTVTAGFERCYAQARARMAVAPLISADLPSTRVRPAPRARSRARG